MLCPKCGASIDDSSRFCQSCGTGTAINVGKTAEVSSAAIGAVSPTEAPPAPASAPTPVSAAASAPAARQAKIASVGAALVAGIVAAAVIFYMHTKSTPATPSTAAASAAAANATAAANAAADDYRWTGLTEDQIQAERTALDAAIAHEEQTARTPAAGAPGAYSRGVRPAATPDKVQM